MANDTTTVPLLDTIEPDLQQHLVSRREAIRKGAWCSSATAWALASGSVPLALAALSKEAGAQTSTVTDVLNFALALEIFENELYKAVLGTSTSSAQNAVFAAVRPQIPAAAVTSVQKIQQHENSHVLFLQSQGATNVFGLTPASFDFTGARGAGNGPFARAGSEVAFLLLAAQGVEDTGVRAYKGQAPNLQSNSVALEAALRIHSVEARHAAKIRRLRRQTGATSVKFSGTVSGTGSAAAGAGNISNPPAGAVAALDLIYANDAVLTQGGVNLTTLPNIPTGIDTNATSEAFDEPLTRAQIVTIVQGFFIPTIQ